MPHADVIARVLRWLSGLASTPHVRPQTEHLSFGSIACGGDMGRGGDRMGGRDRGGSHGFTFGVGNPCGYGYDYGYSDYGYDRAAIKCAKCAPDTGCVGAAFMFATKSLIGS